MTVQRLYFTVIIALLALVTCGCTPAVPAPSDDQSKAFAELFPIADMNHSLKLTLIEVKLGKYGVDIHIAVENQGQWPIVFSTAAGQPPYVRPFVIQDGLWLELPNGVQYLSSTGGDSFTLEAPGANQSSSLTTHVRPDFEANPADTRQPGLVRILVMGAAQGDGQPVGAYLDVLVER